MPIHRNFSTSYSIFFKKHFQQCLFKKRAKALESAFFNKLKKHKSYKNFWISSARLSNSSLFNCTLLTKRVSSISFNGIKCT